MGYGIIAVDHGNLRLLEMSIMKLSRAKDNYDRLRLIHDKVSELIAKHEPHCFAIEAPFFGKNVQSMLKLGRAQGVAIAAAMHAGLDVFEYSPKKIKLSITGYGNADKQQVWKMLQRMMMLQERDLRYLDASDAVAVAVCHHFQENAIVKPAGKTVKGWGEFISNNPQRVQPR